MPKRRKSYTRKPFHVLSRKQKWARLKKTAAHPVVHLNTNPNQQTSSSESQDDTSYSTSEPSLVVNKYDALLNIHSAKERCDKIASSSSKNCNTIANSMLHQTSSESFHEVHSPEVGSIETSPNIQHSEENYDEMPDVVGEQCSTGAESNLKSRQQLLSSNPHISATTLIQEWALDEVNVPKMAISRLLNKLKVIHSELPRSYKTLIPTPTLNYEKMGEGLYIHFSNLKETLQRLLNEHFATAKRTFTSDRVHFSGKYRWFTTVQTFPRLQDISNIVFHI